MATFVELQTLGDKRVILRCSQIDRLELYPGANAESDVSDKSPLVVVTRDGARFQTYGRNAQWLMLAILTQRHAVMLDTPDQALADGMP